MYSSRFWVSSNSYVVRTRARTEAAQSLDPVCVPVPPLISIAPE